MPLRRAKKHCTFANVCRESTLKFLGHLPDLSYQRYDSERDTIGSLLSIQRLLSMNKMYIRNIYAKIQFTYLMI